MKQSLRHLFTRTNGLIRIKPKIRVTDGQTLALIYTPGVGHICKVIEKDPDEIYNLCITGNSIALISDGSALGVTAPDQVIPNLEAASALYKQFYDIDSYPIVLDSSKIQGVQDLILLFDNLSPAYRTIVLIDMEEKKTQEIIKAVEESNLETTIIISNTHNLRQQLKDAALIKSVLDCRALLKPSQWRKVLEAINNTDFNQLPNNLTATLTEAYQVGVQTLFQNKWIHRTVANIDPSEMVSKLSDLYLYGETVYYKPWPKGHCIQKCDNNENSLVLHRRYNGVITIETKFQPRSLGELFKIYQWSYSNDDLGYLRNMIKEYPQKVNEMTFKKNYAAIITNGTAILGFGNIGPVAGMPVMEGKSVLFNALGGIDLIPICMKEKNPHKLVQLIQMIAPAFSAINLEDLKAPDCFPIEQEAIQQLNIPLMHDDQHGTAVVCLAAIINGLKILKKQPKDMKLVINGAGAAGVAIAKLLHGHGITDILICDTEGIIYEGRPKNMNDFKNGLAKFTNLNKIEGKLAEAVKGRDIFVGVSAPGALTQDMIRSMNKDPFILALANPVPEIFPNEAHEAGAFIVCTGRSDFHNQVNNSLAFPGIFRGAIDTKAREINLAMKIAASHAIADCIDEKDLTHDALLPQALAAESSAKVAKAVAQAAIDSGVARQKIDPDVVYDYARKLIMEGNIPNL